MTDDPWDHIDDIEPWSDDELADLQEADRQEVEDARAYRRRKAERNAQQRLAREDAATDGVPEIATFAEEAEADPPEDEWLVEGLIAVDSRVLLGGYRKAGKTVLALNLIVALVTGEDFLGMFKVRAPSGRRVAWLNMELARPRAQRWITALREWVSPVEALENVIAVHLRGATSAYNVMTEDGAAALRRMLTAMDVEILVIDPVAPFIAAAGLDPNTEVGIFMARVDAIASTGGVDTVIYVAHVSKATAHQDGMESVKGDTRWEDGVDSIILIGKEPESGHRWIRAEGRDVDLDNVTLELDDELKRLSAAAVSRYERELRAGAEAVLAVVRLDPGVLTETLLGNPKLRGTKAKRKAYVAEAVALKWIKKEPASPAGMGHWPLV